jgi:hypothetical protein
LTKRLKLPFTVNSARPLYADSSILTIAAVFLHLGCTAFGGLAMLEPMRRRVVDRQQWLEAQEFLDGLALVTWQMGAGALHGPHRLQSGSHLGGCGRGRPFPAGLVSEPPSY